MSQTDLSFVAQEIHINNINGIVSVLACVTPDYKGDYVVQVRDNGVLFVYRNDDVVLVTNRYRLQISVVKEDKNDEQDK